MQTGFDPMAAENIRGVLPGPQHQLSPAVQPERLHHAANVITYGVVLDPELRGEFIVA
jgi:hypothetical protein